MTKNAVHPPAATEHRIPKTRKMRRISISSFQFPGIPGMPYSYLHRHILPGELKVSGASFEVRLRFSASPRLWVRWF